MKEAFFRRHPVAFCGEAKRNEGKLFSCFFHSLSQHTFDHSTMTKVFPHLTVHLDKKDGEDRHEDEERSRKADHTI